MIQSEPQIYIVQNDPSIRNALRNLLKSVDLHAQFFTSALEFKTAERPDILSCLILDVRLPGMSGLDLSWN